MSDYKNDDFVYVDPENKQVLGLVEWDKQGNAIPKYKPEKKQDNGEEATKNSAPRFRKRKKQAYPWGSYGCVKKMYKLAGKDAAEESTMTVDEAIGKAVEEPYWD